MVVGSASVTNAPLAQSVECFHGKEEVNGSIPLGGSITIIITMEVVELDLND